MAVSYEVALHPQARKDLDRVPGSDFSKLDKALLSLKANPRPFGSKKLDAHLWRIRVGNWRAVYAVRDDIKKVVVLHVRRRNERTYKNI